MGMNAGMLTSSSDNKPRMTKNKKPSSHNILNFVFDQHIEFYSTRCNKRYIDTKKAEDDLQYST
jgi:hypothetical protein